jgi:hypothetical protein
MARIRASVTLDPNRTREQRAFIADRQSSIQVLRDLGGSLWVAMEDNQVDTLLGQGMAVVALPDAELVELPAITFDPGTQTVEPPDDLRRQEPTGDATADYLVQFVAPPDKAWIQEIATIGGELLQNVPTHAAVYRFTRAEADAVRALSYVAHAGPYHPAYTVLPELAGAEAPFTATSLRTLRVTVPPDREEGNLRLQFFEGLDPEGARSAVEAAGATIVDEASHGFVVRVPQDRALDVLRVPGLFAAEPPAQTVTTNNNGGVVVGTNQVRTVGAVNFLVNLNGQGEIGGMVDSGIDVGTLAGAVPPFGGAVMTAFHPDLATNVRLVRNTTNPANAALTAPDNSPHGTHVAGTMCGDGASSAGQVRGMAPAASLVAQGPLPGNFQRPFEFAFQNGARVINNSWGSAFVGTTITNNRYINSIGRDLDRWCFSHPDVLLCFAAGNDEDDANGNGVMDARFLKLEATAKNVFTVGASENLRTNGGWPYDYQTYFGKFAAIAGSAGAVGAYIMSDAANDVALFSARGTIQTSGGAVTGRRKPDIVAPGTNVLSCRSQWVQPPPALPGGPPPAAPNAFWNNNWDSVVPGALNRSLYQVFHGTSMATPVTSGSALLVRQYYRTRFAQLRRPLLLQGIPLPAAAPLPVFASFPTLASHPDGLVLAWCAPALPADPKNVVAVRLGRNLAPVDGTPIQLQAGVGDHAAPKVVTRQERTYLLHRHGDGTMRLSCFRRDLTALEAGFGAAGVVTLAQQAKMNDDVPPNVLQVGEHLAVVYPAAGGNEYRLQRFRHDTGAAVDAQPVTLMDVTNTGPHKPVAHGLTRYVVCGVVHPGNFQLRVARMGDNGQLVPGGPTVLVDQAAELREPCIVWNQRRSRFVVVWCDARTVAGGEIYLQFLDSDGAPIGVPRLVVSVPAANRVRRPRILPHGQTGHILLWEDDTQGAHFDVYAALLDDSGAVDGRLPQDPNDPGGRRMVRLSDTPEDTLGFAAMADANGVSAVFQSPDEINSDRLAAYAVNLTPDGAFAAQEDPSTPMLRSGRYVAVQALSHDQTPFSVVAAEWAGGAYYLLRVAPTGVGTSELQWVRLTADGRVDPAYANAGVRATPVAFLLSGVELLWAGTTLLAAVNDHLSGITIHRFDAQGAPLAGFGVGGAAALQDTVSIEDRHTPQVGFDPSNSRVPVAYITRQGADFQNIQMRYQRLDAAGAQVAAPVNLVGVSGVARHQWFMFVPSESRCIAVYHRVAGAVTRIHCRRFTATGGASGGEQNISAAAGEAINAVIARRPTAENSSNREYAVAWQYRAAPDNRWEIRFSRLDRSGVPRANPPAPAPPRPTSDFTVIAPATPGWAADRDAIEPQLVCTYTHWPWDSIPAGPLPGGQQLPAWSPSYGLAWIGVLPDSTRALFFTVLDENGRRAPIQQAPPVGAGPLPGPQQAPLLQVSAAGASVLDYRLVWNGRIFLLTWTEEEAGTLRHRYTAVTRHAHQVVHDIPSAALLRATLVNSATNIQSTSLPDAANGYGWGRLNLRQAMSPAPPVTLHVRDDCAIGPGQTITYRFTLPAGTALLRVTLNWTDPAGPRVVNPLHLTVRAPAVGANPANVYRGNLWDPAAGQNHLSRPINPAAAADAHENVHPFKQVVLQNPPAGEYVVEVETTFGTDAFNQQNLQAFALVFAGTGPEVTFNQPVAAVQGAAIY